MKNFEILLHLFPIVVRVSIGETKEQIGQTLLMYESFNIETFNESFSTDDKDGCVFGMDNMLIIWLKENLDVKADAGLIAHEALHAVHHILNYIGMELSDQTEEIYAHLIDYIVSKIVENI